MGYRKQQTKRKSYMPQRRVFASPSAWTDGFQGALQKAEALAKDGWIIDVDQGALTNEEANAVAAEAKKKGFETEMIPIAEIEGDVVAQFVAVKPKQTAAAAQEPEEEPQAASTAFTPEQIEALFINEFWNGKPSDTAVDNGFIMSQDSVVALGRRDSTSSSNVLAKGRTALAQPWGELDAESYGALQLAKKNKKKSIALGTTGNETKVSIDNLVKAMRVLGKKVKIVNDGSKDSVLYLGNQDGDIMALAPRIDDSGLTAPDPENIGYNEALAAYRTAHGGNANV